MKIIAVAFKYLKRYPLLSAAALASMVGASFFEGISFGMVIPLIQGMMKGGGSSILDRFPLAQRLPVPLSSMDQVTFLSVIFAILFAALVVKNVFLYLSNMLIAKLRFGLSRDLSTGLMDRLIGYDLRFFDVTKTGHLISTINAETGRMGDFLLAALNFTAIAIRVATYTALLFLISWKVSLAIAAMAACVLVPLEFVMKKLRKLGAKMSRALADYNFKLAEILSGIRVIKACGAEDAERKSFRETADRIFDHQYKINRYIYLRMPLSETIIFGMIVGILLFLMSVMKLDISGAFPFIAAYMLVLTKTLTQLNLLNSYRSHAAGNLAAFDTYERLCDGKGYRAITGGSRVSSGLSDAIAFNDVGFSYNGSRQVLNGVTCRIPKGRITAIVGASGAGKSTLANLVMRFYDVTSGSITVDGVDLREFSLAEWRRKIGLVSQDVFIFNASVRDNIAYGRAGISPGRVAEAARVANAHDFIMALPDGYDTVVGERGAQLSGGQKQRISIARAIIHDPEILILDEATSSLDSDTEKLIKQAIDRLTKDRTVIAIAHRLSTIAHADAIIVLEKGRIHERGTHQELLKKDGLYRQLCASQFVMDS